MPAGKHGLSCPCFPRAQHSTPLLCTVLSDTSPPPRGGL
nr:MAG TPA: hypothetical protein [Microviridae sp.]